VGERYKCSDANCGCEIEVTNPGRTQQGTSVDSSMNAGSFNERSRGNQPTGASGTGETGVGATSEPPEEISALHLPAAWVQLRPAPRGPARKVHVPPTSKQDQVANQTSTAPVDSLCTKLKQAAAPQAPGCSLDFRFTSIPKRRVGHRAASPF
jgi:hypothetical protein